jgi:hypothetical protein
MLDSVTFTADEKRVVHFRYYVGVNKSLVVDPQTTNRKLFSSVECIKHAQSDRNLSFPGGPILTD